MDELLKLLGEDQEVVRELIKSQVNEYKPLVYMIGEELLEIYKDYANNKELFLTTATVKKNQFDAYVELGFTDDQAITLLLNDMTNMKKSISNFASSIGKSNASKK